MPPIVEATSSHFFSDDAARLCAEEISAAGGVEVFFIGRRDESGLIVEVESHAYGRANQVPALLNLPRPGEVMIHNHPSGELTPSVPDLDVASALGNQGVGFYIIDNQCSRCRVVVKAQEAKKKALLGSDEVVESLLPGGALSRAVDDFEDRPQQRDMALSVTRSLNDDGISVIEAGTGTGKSFAYLVPAILFALRNDERIVISTNTINLQEQLLSKDIPALRRLLGRDFEVEIVKGRGNYVCKRKAEFARNEGQLLIEDQYLRELNELLEWAKESPSGDRSELPTTPSGEVWERVASESDNCLRLRCPFYEECFYYNSRRRAARAKLLIVNHSLLMSDLAIRRVTNNYTTAAVLPPYSRVILDEAHHLEDVATRNLASQVTRPGVRQILGRLHRRESGGRGRGVLDSFAEDLEKARAQALLPPDCDVPMRVEAELIPRVLDLRESIDFLLQEFSQQFLSLAGLRPPAPRQEHRVRLTEKLTSKPAWRDECAGLIHQAATELSAFIDLNKQILIEIEQFEEGAVEIIINPLTEWRAIVERLATLRLTLLNFLHHDAGTCRWVELGLRPDKRDLIVRLCLAPIDVREVLAEALHKRMKSEILTSATLTVDKEFNYFTERCGIPTQPAIQEPQYDEDGLEIRHQDDEQALRVETLQLDTPFDYSEQVFLGVPTDLPDPRESDFTEALADFVARAVALSGGRAFILFTSYAQMNAVANLCESTIRRLGIEVLRQGTENRETLLARFREDETSVLFATSSFWEGVDVKGRALELLIIARLPFSVPTEPIYEAQYEAVQAQGRDPFHTLVVPRAVIRFKQGFGRLIRSRTDRGAVLIADRRVLEQAYGRRFLRSLPDVPLRKGPKELLFGDLAGFLNKRH